MRIGHKQKKLKPCNLKNLSVRAFLSIYTDVEFLKRRKDAIKILKIISGLEISVKSSQEKNYYINHHSGQ